MAFEMSLPRQRPETTHTARRRWVFDEVQLLTHVFFSFLETFRVPLLRFLAAFLAILPPLPVFGCYLSLSLRALGRF